MPVRHQLTVLAVDDVDAMVAFYETCFGWPREVHVPGIWAELSSSEHHRVGFYVRRGFASQAGRPPAARPPKEGVTATELYLIVDDLPAAIERLRAAGAPEISPRAPRDWGDETAYFRDPEGNVLAVAAPLTP